MHNGLARRILVPTDFSEASQAALAYAVSLVEQSNATLHLLHVLEEIVGAGPLAWQLDVHGNIERTIEHNALDDLRHLLPDEECSRMRVRLTVHWGTPAVEILRYAQARHVDLIAMGKRGRGGVKPLLLGHVTDEVVRHAPCTVLSVH